MDIVTLRSAVTVVLFAVFVGIFIWAWSARNKARFDTAAALPFADETLHETSNAASKHQGREQA